MSTVALLTRGDEGWGTGHLRRTGWLQTALAVQNAIDYITICCADDPLARQFFGEENSETRYFPPGWIADDTGQLSRLAAEADLVIVDWLNSSAELVRALQRAGCKTALLDDYGPATPHADIVINSLLAGIETSRRQDGRAVIHSGVDYVQLPPAVSRLRGVAGATAKAMATELRAPAPLSDTVRAVMVSFGGRAQMQLVDQVLACLAQAAYDGQVIVMPAPSPPLQPVGDSVELVPASEDFHSLLAASDMAICAGGLTLYEAAFLGVPALVIAVPSSAAGFERHQLDTARKLAAAGCCRAAGMAGEVTDDELTAVIRELLAAPRLRLELGASGMRLLDGRGLMRTVELLLELL